MSQDVTPNPPDAIAAHQNLPARSPANPATPSESTLADLVARLTVRQQTAFHFLVAGLKPCQIAPKANIPPRTIYRWLSEDVRFIAAHNAWRARTLEFSRARTLAMSGLVLDTLESALKDGDRQVALKVADRLGLFTQKPAGPQTPGEVARSRTRRDLLKRINIARRARELKHAAFPEFRVSNTVYDLDDRIWLLMVERKQALQQEPLELRKEREETQADEAEGDEELTRILQAIRYATEQAADPANPSQSSDPHTAR